MWPSAGWRLRPDGWEQDAIGPPIVAVRSHRLTHHETTGSAGGASLATPGVLRVTSHALGSGVRVTDAAGWIARSMMQAFQQAARDRRIGRWEGEAPAELPVRTVTSSTNFIFVMRPRRRSASPRGVPFAAWGVRQSVAFACCVMPPFRGDDARKKTGRREAAG